MGLRTNTIITLENNEKYVVLNETMYGGTKYFLVMGIDDKLEMSPKDFYKEQKENEQKILIEAIEQIKTIIKENELNYKFKEINNKTYSVVTLTKEISNLEESLIKGQIDNNIYHIEISNNSDGKNVIEVHLANPLNKELEIEKDKK